MPKGQTVLKKSDITKLRVAHEDADRILILLHDHPDPDAMASALALRAVLGRNKQTVAIGHFGTDVSRPENVAMMDLLEIDMMRLTPGRVSDFDSVAMVDVQPPFFGDMFPRVDSVIDHHPKTGNYKAKFLKISVSEGATSTIMTGLLRGSGVEISERLATALLYGIKTDTFSLTRDADDEDVDAFTFLYKRANVGLLRKIEKAEIPSDELTVFGRSLSRHWIEGNVLFVDVGKVGREYMIPKLADFCMQAKDVDWVVSFGVLNDVYFVASLRNVGYVKSAGRVARNIFQMFGSPTGKIKSNGGSLIQGGGGGHRSAAKVVIPMCDIKRVVGGVSQKKIRQWIMKTVMDQTGGE